VVDDDNFTPTKCRTPPLLVSGEGSGSDGASRKAHARAAAAAAGRGAQAERCSWDAGNFHLDR